MYKRILISYDGLPSSQNELISHFDLRQFEGAELFLLGVMPAARYIPVEGGHDEGFRKHVEEQQVQGAATVRAGVRRLQEANRLVRGKFVVGDSVDQITTCARDIKADLIVVGHRYLQGWAARWWRGLSHRSLVDHAHCDVLVVILHQNEP